MKTVYMSSFTGTDLISRTTARDILDYARSMNDNHIVLDFSGVVFISRSFADEFYGCFHSNEHRGFEFEITNANNDVEAMLAAVSKTHGVVRKKSQNGSSINEFSPKTAEDFDAFMNLLGA